MYLAIVRYSLTDGQTDRWTDRRIEVTFPSPLQDTTRRGCLIILSDDVEDTSGPILRDPREDSPRDSATDSPRDPEQPDFARDAPQPVPEHRRSSGRDSRWDASAAATFEVSATSPEVQSPRHCAAGQRDAKDLIT